MPTEQIGLWLKPTTIVALKAEAQRRGVTYSALVDELVARGLAEDLAARGGGMVMQRRDVGGRAARATAMITTPSPARRASRSSALDRGSRGIA